jgi:SAM-dependent methyltransferase
MKSENIDKITVKGFGEEWSRFDQSGLSADELNDRFDEYFDLFPWDELTVDAQGFDLGCGSGRWAKLVSPKVGKLHCIDPSSEALEVAKINLQNKNNCEFHKASVDQIPLENSSMDFGYSLGVLHHIPDTQEALNSCVKKLKIGAPFLIYIYYFFDNRSKWYKILWKISDLLRFFISRLPFFLKLIISQLIALLIYWPLASISLYLEKLGVEVKNIPLSFYRKCSLYTMRTDALDRFGTRLEKRFTKAEVIQMMHNAGLSRIIVSNSTPFYKAIGFKGLIQEQ